MNEKKQKKILALYPEFFSVYGPYERKDGRRIIVLYDGNKRLTKQYARVKLECVLGRRLENDEDVDHIDGDFSNDRKSNLQVINHIEHKKKDVIRALTKKVKCAWCEKEFGLSKTQRAKSNSAAGPFCSRTCTGKYGASVQNGGSKMRRKRISVKYKRK